MTDKFYELSYDFDCFINSTDEYDGYLEVFEGWEYLEETFRHCCASITLGGDKVIAEYEIIRDMDDYVDNYYSYRVVNAQVPKEIEFIAKREYLSMTDFPNLNKADRWPIMSRKMAEVILSVGDFPHQIIPVTFKDYSGVPIECDYVILHLTKLSDLLDLDKSSYTKQLCNVDDDFIKKARKNGLILNNPVVFTAIESINEIVLKEPKNGFPPIFRVEWIDILCVSAETKNALEMAEIKGLIFDPI
jgi:hypothetical protein